MNPVKRIWLLTCTTVLHFLSIYLTKLVKRGEELMANGSAVTQSWRRAGPISRHCHSIGAPSQHPEAPSSRLTRAIHLIHPMRPPWFFPNVKTRNMTTTDKLVIPWSRGFNIRGGAHWAWQGKTPCWFDFLDVKGWRIHILSVVGPYLRPNLG